MERFEQVKPIREDRDLAIYLSTAQGEKVFIKQAKTEGGVVSNTREFYNQKFLHATTEGKDVGFEFLEPAFDGTSLSYPDINETADWLAVDFAPETKIASLSEYSEEMIKFFKFCLDVPYSSLSEEIKIDSEKRLANVLINFDKDSRTLKEVGIVSEVDVQKMRKYIENGIGETAFQHHDVVPWHMARKKSDNKLILVDSGWSGWSLKYYDIAYYALQMTGYAQRPQDSLDFLDIVKDEFKDDPQFKKILSTPFSYRGVRLAAELYRQGKTKNAQDVLSLVLSEI